MKTKPFNLEEALAGKPVVTRAGKEVTQFHLFDAEIDYPLCAVYNEEICSYTPQGEVFDEPKQSNADLFMKAETKTMEAWFNIYPTCIGTAYPTEEQANTMAAENRIECRKITWEVEV